MFDFAVPLNHIHAAVDYIRARTDFVPAHAIILGTGLGTLANEIQAVSILEYKNIPHSPVSTVESHDGKLILGVLAGKNVVAMQGRFHYYEGYSMQQVTFHVRVMKYLGAKNLFVSNACGGINTSFKRGDLMLMCDHINLQGQNPLIGVNEPSYGPRFPDMSMPYDDELILLAAQVAKKANISLHKGVYAAVTGPNLETRAEYRMLRLLGADAVGMSTVPEVIAARQMGMKVLGLSIITDECNPDNLQVARIEDILAAAAAAEPKMTHIFKQVLATL
jgi:purine-nucleoside phosphorylase